MTAETTENHTMDNSEENPTNTAADFDPTLDESTVKFLPEKDENGVPDGDIEMGGKKKEEVQFTGLTKEELQQFATDPFWVKVRYVLFALFIIIWIGILLAAVLIVVFSPKCPPRPDQEWYQEDTIYNIYPRSFQDTNADGVGDLNGIADHLDYFSELGVNALWLSSIYPSSQQDGGQDITDHKAIDSLYGTLSDFKKLVKSMKKKGMKILMDFIPNHTSRDHEWFVESAKGGDNKYANYYVWGGGDDAGNNTAVPNNWMAANGGSAWEKVDARNQYYLHQSMTFEPDLNLRLPEVQKELMDILSFWLDLGVDGFVVKNAQYLFEKEDLSDETVAGEFTRDQPENFALVHHWQELLKNVTDKSEKFRVLLVDAGESASLVNYMGTNETANSAFTVNRKLFALNAATTGTEIKALVSDWLEMMKPDTWTTWMLGDSDTTRVATRVGADKVNIVNMLQLLLPGTAVVYYGNELGMVNGDVSFDLGQDKQPGWDEATYLRLSRDNFRTPMQWDGSANAGFTNGSAWLPVPANHDLLGVKAQRAAGMGTSHIEVFEQLVTLRSEPSFLWGELIWNKVDDDVVAFVRKAEGFPSFLAILNFGGEPRFLNCHSFDADNVPKEGEVVASSANFEHDDFKIGTTLMMDKIVLNANQGVVFKFE